MKWGARRYPFIGSHDSLPISFSLPRQLIVRLVWLFLLQSRELFYSYWWNCYWYLLSPYISDNIEFLQSISFANLMLMMLTSATLYKMVIDTLCGTGLLSKIFRFKNCTWYDRWATIPRNKHWKMIEKASVVSVLWIVSWLDSTRDKIPQYAIHPWSEMAVDETRFFFSTHHTYCALV